MKFYYLLILVLQVIISFSSLPSEDLWNKTIQYISEGKIKTFEKKHFIFDEENYTALGIDSDEMNALYFEQEKLYKTYNLTTFLFICKNLNRTIEDAYSIRDNTRDHLKDYGVYVNNSVFVLISAESNESILYTGSFIKDNYISNKEAEVLNTNIKEKIKNKEYFNALANLLMNIESKCLIKSFSNNKGNDSNFTNYNKNKHKDSGMGALEICGIIFGFILLIGFIIGGICFCKNWKACCEACCSICPKNFNNNNNNDYDRNTNINRFNYGYDRNNTIERNYGNNSVVSNNSGIGKSYGNNSIGGGNNGPSVGGNSIIRASGGAI